MQNRVEENVGMNDTASSSASKSAKGQRSESSTHANTEMRRTQQTWQQICFQLAVTRVANT